MKNLNASIGNQTRDLPASSAVSEPTAPPRLEDYQIFGLLFLIFLLEYIFFYRSLEVQEGNIMVNGFFGLRFMVRVKAGLD